MSRKYEQRLCAERSRVARNLEEQANLADRIAADQARLRDAREKALAEHEAKYGQRLRPIERMPV